MKIRLNRIEGGQALRTNPIEGESPLPPKKGESFVHWSESLTTNGRGKPVGVRRIVTSKVVDIDLIDRGWMITTETGSKYELQVLADDDGPTTKDEDIDG